MEHGSGKPNRDPWELDRAELRQGSDGAGRPSLRRSSAGATGAFTFPKAKWHGGATQGVTQGDKKCRADECRSMAIRCMSCGEFS